MNTMLITTQAKGIVNEVDKMLRITNYVVFKGVGSNPGGSFGFPDHFIPQ